MRTTSLNNDLIFGALHFFIGDEDQPVSIYRDPLGVAFETKSNKKGLVIRNEDGNWDILLNDLKVYEIEHDVFTIITNEENAPALDDYITMLKNVEIKNIQKKSLDFVKGLLGGISLLAYQGFVKNQVPLQYGPYFVYFSKHIGNNKIIMN